jgi:hypothetical protein
LPCWTADRGDRGGAGRAQRAAADERGGDEAPGQRGAEAPAAVRRRGMVGRRLRRGRFIVERGRATFGRVAFEPQKRVGHADEPAARRVSSA